MTISSKYPKDIRAKYALIRIRNIIKRLPRHAQSNVYINHLNDALKGDITEINSFLKLSLKEIIMLEQTCDDLEFLINELNKNAKEDDHDESDSH